MNRRSIKFFLVALTVAILGGLFSGRSSVALALQNSGTDFWLAFPGNSAGADQIQLYIVGTAAATGTVSYAPGSGCTSVGFSLAAPTYSATIAPACAVEIRTSDTIQPKGVHVVVDSGSPVTVYGFSGAGPSADRSTDGFLALPINALGKAYFTVSHPGLDPSSASQFVIVATVNGTTVSITPKAQMGNHPARRPFSPATLNQGDTYLGLSGFDLTGTLITSNHPIAVFSGDRCSNIPINKASCGTTVEQLPPLEQWGRIFVTTPHLTPESATPPYTFATRLPGGDLFRIVAAGEDTTVKVNGTTAPVLAAGQALDIVQATGPQVIEADRPILVTQFEQSHGSDSFGFNDPSMMLVAPQRQWLSDYRVTTPASSTNPVFDLNFINLVAPNAAIVTVDGTALDGSAWTQIGATAFKSTRLQVTAGTHTLTGDPALPFGVSTYGTAPATAYSYPGGLGVNNLCLGTGPELTPTPLSQNCPPVAVNDYARTEINTAIVIDVLANDFDSDRILNPDPASQPLRVLPDFPNLVPASAGTLETLPGNLQIKFTPAMGFNGQVFFDYRITDGDHGGTARASVSLGVGVDPSLDINRPPIAFGETLSVAENTTLTGNVGIDNGFGADFDMDGDPLTFELVVPPQHALLGGFSLAANGAFTYTPNTNFHGVDTFQYRAKDPGRLPTSPQLASNVVTVTINITGNQAPIATANDYWMLPRCPAGNWLCSNTSSLTGNVIRDNAGHGVDSDPEGDSLNAVLVTPPPPAATGTFSFAADGAFNYQPPAGFTGPVTFTYKVNDRVTKLPPGVHFLTDSDAETLTGWLGSGPVRFELLFSKRGNDGKTVADLHAAIDGIPRTLTVIQAKDDLDPSRPVQIFGGYNPGVFTSLDASVETVNDADRTAFLFNLTENRLLPQRLSTQRCQGALPGLFDCGPLQIVNSGPAVGPAWGNGWDLLIGCSLAGCDNPDPKVEVGATASFTYGTVGIGTFSEGPGDRIAAFFSPTIPDALRTVGQCAHVGGQDCGQFSMTDPANGFEVYAVRPFFGEFAGTDSAPATVTINVVSDSMTLTASTFSYNGQPHPAMCTLTASDGAILLPTVTYNTPGGLAPVAAGSYTATCSFPGDAVGHPAVTRTLVDAVTIAKASVSFDITGAGFYPYDGYDHGIHCTVISPDKTVLLSATGGAPTPHDIGVYHPVCEFKGDANHLASSAQVLVTIGKRPLTVTAIAGQTKVYGSPDPSLAYQITSGSLLPGDNLTGSPTRVTGESKGKYAIGQGTLGAVSPVGDIYALTFVGDDLTITPKPITVTANSGQTKVYASLDPVFTYTVPAGALVVGDGFTGTLTRDSGVNVGTYAIRQGTLSPGANYDVSFVSANLEITPRPITVTADAQAKVYGRPDPALTYLVTSGSLVPGDAFSGSLVRPGNDNVGQHPIEVGSLSAGLNYTLTFIGANLTITQGPVTIVITGGPFIYDGDDHQIVCKAKSADGTILLPIALGYQQIDGPGGTPHNVGTYNATCSFNGDANNAPVSRTVQVKVDPRSLTVTADPKSKEYGQADPAFPYQLTSGTLVPGEVFSGALGRAAGENVGPHPIQLGTLTAGPNYAITVVGGNLTITEAAITVAADAQTKVYGSPDPTLTYRVTSGRLFFNDAFTGALTRAPGANVGTYTIGQGLLSAGNNYSLTFVGANLTIGPAALTVAADNKTKIEGQPPPAFTATITGFVNGDIQATAVTGAPVFSTVAITSPPGTYPIVVTVGTLAAANYTFATFVNGTLTVLTANHQPIANPDTASTLESKPVTINVLANDTDVDGDVLSVSTVSTPAHGTATAGAGGAITYTPAAQFFPIDTFTYTVVDGKGGTAVGTVSVTISRLGRFVVFSRDMTWLRSNTTVLTGDVGANERRNRNESGHGTEFDDGDRDNADRDNRDNANRDDRDHVDWNGATVRIGDSVKVLEVGSRVVGDTVVLRNKSIIYNLVDNLTVASGTATILGTVTHPMAIPYLTMPAFPSFSAGSSNVEVAKKATLTLAAGAYGKVHVSSGATLILSGGLYRMLALDIDQSATVIFHAATEVRIKGELDTDNKSKMILDPAVPTLKASQVVFYVAGSNDSCNHNGRDVDDNDNGGKAGVHIGENSVVQANIYAPNGTIWIKSKTTATGAFIGQAVRVGQKATLTLDSAFKF